MTQQHRPSRYGGEMLLVRSADCTPTDETGAACHFQPSRPIVAAHGLRLLLSLQQATYSKSIANVTMANNRIVFQYKHKGKTQRSECTIPNGLYSTGAQLSSTIQAYNQKTTVDLSVMVLCVYNEVTGRFTFSRTNDRGVFKIGMETTMADLVGLAATQLDDPQTTIESAHAANLTPCSAMLVKLDISCDAIEAASRGAGGGIVARIPTVGLLSTGFVVDCWAPFQLHVRLLHERFITALSISLIDSDTFELIEFTDKRGWTLNFRIDYVHTPDAIARTAIDSEVGLAISSAMVKSLEPDATVNPQGRPQSRQGAKTRKQSITALIEDRKANRRRRRRRRNPGGTP